MWHALLYCLPPQLRCTLCTLHPLHSEAGDGANRVAIATVERVAAAGQIGNARIIEIGRALQCAIACAYNL